MSEPEIIEETTPSQPQADPIADPAATQQVAAVSAGAARPRRWTWILGGLGILLLLAGLGALAGYQTAVGARRHEQLLQSAVEAHYQYELALADLQVGACTRAKDRLVYVIELMPDHPGAANSLVEALMCVEGEPSGTAGVDTPVEAEPEPTPDLRGAEAIFNDIPARMAARDWSGTLILLDTLRRNFPDFQPIEVDGFYYVTLRQRGIARILSGELEPGIFDLNRAEQLGPLDNEVANYRQWAIWYLVGSSFWEIDWPQALQYFGYVKDAVPSLHDLSYMSALDRYNTALVFYGEGLVEEAARLATQRQWCTAEEKIYEANSITPLTEEQQAAADHYSQNCLDHGNE
ncbi:MAG: hypothetical protein KIS85_02125 [Anaerolineales bacterium]|nr:hypothetical protein [Anaerolineales bacterium]